MLLIVWVALSFVVPVPWQSEAPTDSEPVYHKVLLLSDGLRKPQSYAYDALLLDYSDSSMLTPPADITLYFALDSNFCYRAGDVVLARTAITEARGYVRWGEAAWLEHRTARDISLVQGKIPFIARRCRDKMEQMLASYDIGAEEEALIESLVLGDRRSLSIDQREAFQDAGAMHVLAVSGLHVGIIRGILIFILLAGGTLTIPREKRWQHRMVRIVILLLIWAYAFLTGLSTPVLRSALMFSLLPLYAQRNQSPTRYNALATAALVILVINPAAIRSVSFLLSFSAVFALMYFSPRWTRFLNNTLPSIRTSGPWYIALVQRLRGKIRSLLLASLAAQIGTLPWTLLFFGQASNYFFLTNLLVIPLAGALAMSALLFFCAAGLFGRCVLSVGILRVTEIVAECMNGFVDWVQHLPGATSFYSFTPLMCVLLILLIISLAMTARLYAPVPNINLDLLNRPYQSDAISPHATTIEAKLAREADRKQKNRRRLVGLLLSALIAATLATVYYLHISQMY